MLSLHNKSVNKYYDFNPKTKFKNFSKLPFNFFETSKLSDTPLLDHYSVIGQKTFSLIQELYPEYDINRVLEPSDLHHERDKKNIQDLLKNKITDKNKLEFYQKDYELIIDKFLTYMSNISKSKFLLVGSGDDNKKIVWEGLNRYQSNRNVNKYSKELDILENANIPACMITLTYDHDKRDLKSAWENVSKDLHAFRKKLFYEIGKLPYLWVIEAQKSGYPHIHMLLFGTDYVYWNGNYEEYQDRKNGLKTDKSIQSMWGFGFTSVNKTLEGKKVKNPIHYVMKYVRKVWNDWNYEAVLTKSLLWAFNKRSFNVSRNFSQYCMSLKPMDQDHKTFNVELVNPVELIGCVVITKRKFMPKHSKIENPYMPITVLYQNTIIANSGPEIKKAVFRLKSYSDYNFNRIIYKYGLGKLFYEFNLRIMK
jgi:hypothetical protein